MKWSKKFFQEIQEICKWLSKQLHSSSFSSSWFVKIAIKLEKLFSSQSPQLTQNKSEYNSASSNVRMFVSYCLSSNMVDRRYKLAARIVFSFAGIRNNNPPIENVTSEKPCSLKPHTTKYQIFVSADLMRQNVWNALLRIYIMTK